ncbi:MAG: BtrH N-terminal domain-containing protein [Gorillibacterium sp.]|nr:BtrH N-terminal domain-containing protein [Gorillibacterium sp.]
MEGEQDAPVDWQQALDVPRYYEPYVNDCFANAYGSLLAHKGLDPAIGLADYLCFMYDSELEYIGVNFLNRVSATVEFTEEELNSSMPFAYLPATSLYGKCDRKDIHQSDHEHFQIHMYYHDDPGVADARVKELLNQSEPIIVVVDLYEIHYHRAYKQQHGLHAIVVTGYDERLQEYVLFDKYAMSSSDFDGALSMEEVAAGRIAECENTNPLTGTILRPIRNLWMELHVHPEFHFSEERAKALVRGSCLRMRGQEQVHGRVCGFTALDAYIDRLLSKRSVVFDDTEKYRFRFYYNMALKTVARQRKRFKAFLSAADAAFGWDTLRHVQNGLDEAALRWDIAANLSLKLGITGKLVNLDELAGQLRMAQRAEEQVVAWLEAWCM